MCVKLCIGWLITCSFNTLNFLFKNRINAVLFVAKNVLIDISDNTTDPGSSCVTAYDDPFELMARNMPLLSYNPKQLSLMQQDADNDDGGNLQKF